MSDFNLHLQHTIIRLIIVELNVPLLFLVNPIGMISPKLEAQNGTAEYKNPLYHVLFALETILAIHNTTEFPAKLAA